MIYILMNMNNNSKIKDDLKDNKADNSLFGSDKI